MPDAWLDILARLLLSVIVGAVIGLNRDLHHKQAGVRTNALVSLGAALAVLVVAPPGIDPTHRIDAMSRVIQGVITGIGFLGAGVILRNPASHRVSGLTTAAAVWLAALLGVACGAGNYAAVLIALVLGIGVIVCGGPLERWFRKSDDRLVEPDPKTEKRDDSLQ
ncbi:MAG TPA: MgtC/SapB family protein [Rhodanobacteraceae bacterium]|jgi:putative Mg2+ transporter-C (MgtC) family protein|nr:MgtC/SapB family protein [Rhodanobacteraceae bacterium]